MRKCNYCKKLIFNSSKMHEYNNGIRYCDKCNFFYNKANNIYGKVPKGIIENFIGKYGIYPNEKELRMLHGLMEKKYKIYLNIKELYNTLPWIKQRLDEEKELKRFENDLRYNKIKDHYCFICKKTITKKQFGYSIDVFGKALCSQHQKEEKATTQAKKLFNALQLRKIQCKLELSDKFRSVDISIPKAQMNIEIGGSHNTTDPIQLKLDLERDFQSYENGYVTKRLTNSQIDNNLEKIADALANVAKDRIKQFGNNNT